MFENDAFFIEPFLKLWGALIMNFVLQRKTLIYRLQEELLFNVHMQFENK